MQTIKLGPIQNFWHFLAIFEKKIRVLTLRLITLKLDFLQTIQELASESGTQTAAWSLAAFFPPFLNTVIYY